MKKLTLLTLLFALFNLNTFASYRPNVENLPHKGMQFEFLGSHFISTEKIDSNGNTEPFISDEAFTKTEYSIKARYSYTKKVEFRGEFRYRSNDSTEYSSTAQKSYPLTEAGPESYAVGLKFKLPTYKLWRFGIDLHYRDVFFDNPAYDATNPYAFVVLGDDNSAVTIGGYVVRPFAKRYYLSVYGAGVLNSEISNELLYDMQISGMVNKKITLMVGLGGIRSLNGDAYDATPSTKPKIGRGATRLFNSINRSYMAPYLGVQVNWNKNWATGFRYQKRMSGISTDHGDEMMLNLVWTPKEGRTAEKIKIGKFKNYTIEASVIRVSPRGKFLKIDKGLSDDIEVKQRIDIYKHDYLGGNILVATGRVYEVKAQTAIIRIEKFFKKIKIEKGFLARAE